MSLHLFTVAREQSQPSSSSELADELRLLCAYENGGVTLRRYARPEKLKSVEGVGWEIVWSVKLHVEASMLFHLNHHCASNQTSNGHESIQGQRFSVDSVCRSPYWSVQSLGRLLVFSHLRNLPDLASFQNADKTFPDTACVAHRTKHPGNSSIAIRDDGKVCAVGGWDGQYVLPFMFASS